MNARLDNAIVAVRDAIATAAEVPRESVAFDDDLVSELALCPLEQESLRLILEEIFGVVVPEEIWTTPLYRTATSLAEWLISRSNMAAWIEARCQLPPRRKCA